MSQQPNHSTSLVLLGIRLFVLFQIILLLTQISSSVMMITTAPDQYVAAFIIAPLTITLTILLIAWLSAPTLAKRINGQIDVCKTNAIDPLSLQSIGMTLIGIYFLLHSLPSFFAEVTTSLISPQTGMHTVASHTVYFNDVLSYFFTIIISLWLIFQSNGIAYTIQRMKNFGKQN